MNRDFSELAERLGLDFGDPGLLRRALTHSSYANEKEEEPEDNERLEYLGDAVLQLVVSEYLYTRYPKSPEGLLSRWRASVVSRPYLAGVASRLGLGEWLFLGRGEEQSGGRRRSSILSNALEAMIGAAYLDGGYEAARDLVVRWLGDRLDSFTDASDAKDYKSLLQEEAQRQSRQVDYRLVAEYGPDHDKRFMTEVAVDGVVLGRGEGRRKKDAEQEAARMALKKVLGKG